MHEDYSRRVEIKLSKDRTFGLVFGTFFAIVGAFPMLHGRPPRVWSLTVSGVFFAVSLIQPTLLHPLNLAAKKLSEILHRFISPLVAGIFFFVFLTPVAILSRIFRKDPLNVLFDRDAQTYWVKRDPPGPAPESMANQF